MATSGEIPRHKLWNITAMRDIDCSYIRAFAKLTWGGIEFTEYLVPVPCPNILNKINMKRSILIINKLLIVNDISMSCYVVLPLFFLRITKTG